MVLLKFSSNGTRNSINTVGWRNESLTWNDQVTGCIVESLLSMKAIKIHNRWLLVNSLSRKFFLELCCVDFLEPTLSIVKKAKQKENFPLEPGWTHLKALSESLMDYAAMLLGFLAGQSAPISFRLPLAIKFPPLLLLLLYSTHSLLALRLTKEEERQQPQKHPFTFVYLHKTYKWKLWHQGNPTVKKKITEKGVHN